MRAIRTPKLLKETLAIVLILLLIGCVTSYQSDFKRPDLPEPTQNSEHLCFFVANSSPVDFDDLILTNEKEPAFEGFFDIVYPTSEIEKVLSKHDKGSFTAEAEWMLFFRNPMPWKRSDYEKLDISKIQMRFQGIVEGKWLELLQDKMDNETNHWIPASSENNFYDPNVDTASLPSDFKTVAEWDEIMSNPIIRKQFDSATVLVTYDLPGKHINKQILKGSFKEMREELFADGWNFYPGDLVKRVCDIYYNDYSDSQRKGLRFQGINLAAHGRNAALVNQKSRIVKGLLATLGGLFNPQNWDSSVGFIVRSKRNIVKSIVNDELILGDPSLVSLINIPPPQNLTIDKKVLIESEKGQAETKQSGRTVTIPAGDGTGIVLRYWIGEQGKGAVIYVHGMMSHSGWFSHTGDWLHEHGFTSVAPDRRGSGLSTAPRGHMKHYNQLLNDIQHVIQWIRNRNKNSSIHLVGQCFGALPVLCFAARHPDELTTLTLLSPAIDLHVGMTMWQKIQIGLTAFLFPKYRVPVPLETEDFTELPDELEYIRNDRLNLVSATAKFYLQTARLQREAQRTAPRIVTPVFLALAGNDFICDNDAALKFFKSVASQDKLFKFYKGSLHSLEYGSKRMEFLNDWLGWFNKHEN